MPLYGDFKISWVPSWVPNASFSKFVGAMAPLAPMLTHPLDFTGLVFSKMIKITPTSENLKDKQVEGGCLAHSSLLRF